MDVARVRDHLRRWKLFHKLVYVYQLGPPENIMLPHPLSHELRKLVLSVISILYLPIHYKNIKHQRMELGWGTTYRGENGFIS